MSLLSLLIDIIATAALVKYVYFMHWLFQEKNNEADCEEYKNEKVDVAEAAR